MLLDRKRKEFFRGCLLGGAVGDALGWPVEFMRLAEIKKRYGERGIENLVLNADGKAEITDDTQLTLFTAEGLLRASTRRNLRGNCHIPTVVYHAYLRWLHTQGVKCKGGEEIVKNLDGWVSKIKALYARRAPGSTCLSALSNGRMGTIEKHINNSKGCGGVIRVAPVGLMFTKKDAFKIGCELAAITHGHPGGYLSAGLHVCIISCLIEGMELEDAVSAAIQELAAYPGSEECLGLINKAVELAQDNDPSEDALKQLGEGWVGEEAIAIAVYCLLVYKNDFKKAVCLAVNHDGDSDSTGAITGNILGACLGVEGIPPVWWEHVELRDEIIAVADDLQIGFEESERWLKKYPGW